MDHGVYSMHLNVVFLEMCKHMFLFINSTCNPIAKLLVYRHHLRLQRHHHIFKL